ncbi:MAG TPA: hypothetical protein ACFYD4_03650 [Candidatus Wunengus sp. YC61]|uniref:hypothetical protein n=1 Tax=Candidatus Wunengus sp. YC61 TaxID=3367698 RepID=UPI004025D5B8
MKGMLPVFLISVFLLFVLLGVKNADAEDKGGSQEVLKELDDFQRSLSNWMKNLDTMGSQFTTLQKNVSESLAPLKEFDKMMKGIDEKLNNNISKMESLEKTASVAEVKGMLDSFGKTFDVLKKLLSDLTKRVEDQEVKAAVLEKRYQEAQRPLDPIKKAIEDLNKLVTDKLGEQEKKITSLEDSLKTRVASLDSSMKTFDGQMKTVSDLEIRMKKVEKKSGGSAGTTTAEVPPVAQVQAAMGTETVKVAVGTETTAVAEVAKEHIPTPEEEGFKEMEDGFYIRNINLFPFGSSSQIKGEIKNFSDRDRSIATFTIKVYNASDTLLFTQDFSIKTFKKGDIRAFSEIISGYTPLDIARYEIIPKRRY